MNTPKTLETVIVVRHGEESSDLITQTGIKQMEYLAKRITALIKGKSVLILTSTQPRAIQSSDVILRYLKPLFPTLESKSITELSGTYAMRDLQLIRIMKIVGPAQVLIILTHGTSPSGINDALAESGFGGEVAGEEPSANGHGFIITRGVKKLTCIPW